MTTCVVADDDHGTLAAVAVHYSRAEWRAEYDAMLAALPGSNYPFGLVQQREEHARQPRSGRAGLGAGGPGIDGLTSRGTRIDLGQRAAPFDRATR